MEGMCAADERRRRCDEAEVEMTPELVEGASVAIGNRDWMLRKSVHGSGRERMAEGK